MSSLLRLVLAVAAGIAWTVLTVVAGAALLRSLQGGSRRRAWTLLSMLWAACFTLVGLGLFLLGRQRPLAAGVALAVAYLSPARLG